MSLVLLDQNNISLNTENQTKVSKIKKMTQFDKWTQNIRHPKSFNSSCQVKTQVFTKFKSSLKSFSFCWVKVQLKTVIKVDSSSHLWQLIWYE